MENAKLDAAFDCVFTLADTGEGLSSLSDLAADCHGEDADRLAACIRSAGLVEGVLVTSLAEDASEATVCAALSLLGNLLTDEYDVDAHQSLDLFESAGGLDALIALLRTHGYPINGIYSHRHLFALAALRNLTSLDPHGSCCEKLRGLGADELLTELIQSGENGDDPIEAAIHEYATGTLANLRAFDPAPHAADAIQEEIRLVRLESWKEYSSSDRRF